MQYVRLDIERFVAIMDAAAFFAAYSSGEVGQNPPPKVGRPTSLRGPSLCPSENGGAPKLRSPFPLLAGIKAHTLCEEIVHLG
jgi:hypothetical protein